MKRGTLEVLLVNAEGIKHNNFLGRPAYYVLIECGTKVHKSKVTTGYDQEAYWNQKFKFEFHLSEWKNLGYLKISIKDKRHFKDGGFVGQSLIDLIGIVTEGIDKEIIELQPSPYNVVLEDNTYKGQIKLGFTFKMKEEDESEEPVEAVVVAEEKGKPMYAVLLEFLKISSLWRFIFSKQ